MLQATSFKKINKKIIKNQRNPIAIGSAPACRIFSEGRAKKTSLQLPII
jgi:hypothetical protein